MLYTKKKAPQRTVDIPESIFRYILMWRTEICGERNADRTQYWEDWLKKNKKKKELGYLVSRNIREHVREVDLENKRLRREHESLKETREALSRLGFKPYEMDWDQENKLRQRIQEINTGIGRNILTTIDVSIDALKRTREALS